MLGQAQAAAAEGEHRGAPGGGDRLGGRSRGPDRGAGTVAGRGYGVAPGDLVPLVGGGVEADLGHAATAEVVDLALDGGRVAGAVAVPAVAGLDVEPPGVGRGRGRAGGAGG